MMAEFRWIIMSLFLMLLFKFTAAATEKYSLVGDEVTLSCENVTHDQDNCDSATWVFSDGGNTEKLFEHGKIDREAEAKSDRLSVTANCSLVIKKVTREDVGRYSCRQFRSGRQVSDSQVDVSVVDMTERQDTDRVILNCSVWIYGHICTHKVKWLYEGDQNDLETSQSTCSASVTFTTSDYNQKLKYSEFLKCEVTDGHTEEVHQFTFSPPQSSGEKPGHDATTAATISSTTTESLLTTGNRWTSVTMSTSEVTNNTASENNNDQLKQGHDATTTTTTTISSATTESPSTTGNKWNLKSENNQTKQDWWKFIVAAVGLAALIIITVAVIRCKRTKGNKTQMDENMADPEADVSYASISYTKNTGRKAKVRLDDDDDGDDDGDDGDAVTFSTVTAPSSSSAGASADPRNLYATINKPTK
ncbi:probable serine/threonine-protein kinase dyrk2 isoform X1 [Epinephelus fuscoguttatus]|uniref:probable serine/threonine-protein kinase dyrk2 isoform X1 n=1 Tax=Epinephelus fuscoguttatus TaxID=293821 RepID=UPI0020D034E2|nr:probable serine/threonine-protein kinase dyrk2 isoform X1 [Epinephelus fuscoguttatus]